MRKTIFALGSLRRIQIKQRDAVVERALKSKRDQRLLLCCFVKLVENSCDARRQRFVLQTVQGFRTHGLIQRGFSNLKLYVMKRKRSRLLNEVADEFRAERV